NPSSGRLNRLDPFAGNMSDPISLHKYLYAHASPTMGFDPSGLFTLKQLAITTGIIGIIAGISTLTFKSITTTNYAVNTSPPTTSDIALVEGPLEGAAATHMIEGVNLPDLANQLRSAGHRVTYVDSPDETQFINLLNTNDIVFS